MSAPRPKPAAELRRLSISKQSRPDPAVPLGPELISFFKSSVQKRQTKLSRIAEAWANLVPPILDTHCALEALHRGTLTVLVDSSSHLYELRQLLLAGLQQQLLLACKSAGLRKITLRPGRWYNSDGSGEKKLRFTR